MKELPAAIEAEQALLGALLLNNDAFHTVAARVEEHHFCDQIHRLVWSAVKRTIEDGRVANPVTIKALMPSDVTIGEMTVGQYLARLATEAVTVVNAPDYAEAIVRSAMRRDGISIAEQLSTASYDLQTDYPKDGDPYYDDVLDEVQSRLDALRAAIAGRQDALGVEVANRYYDAIRSRPEGDTEGVPIRMMEVQAVLRDRMWRVGRLCGLVGSSGEGKTSLAIQIAYDALMDGHPVVIASYDQNSDEIIGQMVSQQTGIAFERQMQGTLNDEQVEKAYTFAMDITAKPLDIIELSFENVTKMGALVRRSIRAMRAKGHTKTPLVIMDHMSAIEPAHDLGKRNEGKIALSVGTAIKALMKAERAAGLVLQQRSTWGLRRDNPRPTGNDIYGGQGALQPFDALWYVFRPEKHRRDQLAQAGTEKEKKAINERWPLLTWEGKAEIGAIKIRFGAPDKRRLLVWDASHTRYSSDHVDASQGSML